MERKLYRYRSFKDDWKEEAFDGIVEPSSPLYFNDPYDCGFCFQEDILSELLGKEDYIKALEKYIPLKREDYDLILSSTDIESAVQIVFQNHGKKFPDSFFKSLRNDASECMDELKDAVRVVCLSETYDSMLMWSHYARNHTGYCIEYEFNKDDMYYSSLHQVRYTKDRFNISKKDILEGRKDIIDKTVCSKADVWSYEKEWRIVTENYIKTRPSKVDPKTRCVLYLKDNIKAFYLGAKINEKEKSEIIEFAKKIIELFIR